MKRIATLGLVVGTWVLVMVPKGWFLTPVWAAGEGGAFVPKITDVTVFKDGHAFIMRQGEANLEQGWCRTRDVPAAMLGAFWAFAVGENVRVDFVKAQFVEVQESRACLNFDEIIQANVGKRISIQTNYQQKPYEGTLLGILQHEAEDEIETQRPRPYRDRWGNIRRRNIPEMQQQRKKQLALFVMLQTETGVRLIKRDQIRELVLPGEKPVTTHTEAKNVREIAVHVLDADKPLNGKARVGLITIQKGIRWIPDYRIRLLGKGKARLSLQGTVINDIAELEDAELRLVVGVPSFLMKGQLSPMALRKMGLHLSAYFAPPAPGGGGQVDISNIIMSQSVRSISREREQRTVSGPSIPSEGQQEDLFLYRKSGVTLKKGARAVVQLLDLTVPYEDIYTWTIAPIPPKEMWRHLNTQQRQLMQRLGGAKAMHEVRLTNTGSAPWTTGPAVLFKEGTPLAQQLLTYTSVNNTVDVPVTIATDLNTIKEEAETGREPNIRISGNTYTKVKLHGTLTVKNFKDRPVHIFITRKVIGAATAATFSATVLPVTVNASPCRMGSSSFMTADTPPAWWKSGTLAAAAGFILAMWGVLRHNFSKRSMVISQSASYPIAGICSATLVEPPMAVLRRIPFSIPF